MASTGPTNRINDQAIRWAVEMTYGEMTPESRVELDAWLAADTRHRGALVRARAWMRATEDAVIEAHSVEVPSPDIPFPASDNDNGSGPDETVAAPLRRGVSRWSGRAAAGAAALTICVTALVAAGVPVLAPFRQTELAATEIVKLNDGTIATLDRDAKIEVTLLPDYRRITLVSGKASFNVAKDKGRPFVVQSGDVYAQATGTVYSVSRAGRFGGTVEVTEGSVLVWPRDERDQAVLLHAGGSVTLDPGPDSSKPKRAAPRLPPPELAQISLDDVPIKSAVARFNRVNSTKIVIADPAIGDIRIIGLYRANDPEAFAQAAATVSGARMVRGQRTIVIKMK